MTTSAPRLKPLKGEASRIFKLCQEKDRKTALQGLELAAALGAPMEDVLEGVSVDAEGKLVRSKRFTGNDRTQPVLDALLLQQLGLAAKGTPEAALRDAITNLVCKVCVLTDLSGFAGLASAHITLDPQFDGGDVSPLGKLAHLRSLNLSTGLVMYGQSRATLPSLKGLDAPRLEVLDVSYLKLTDIEGLSACTRLRQVDLRGNSQLVSIEALESSAGTLESLDLGYCSSITSLRPLRAATRLRSLVIAGLERITSLSDLKKLERLETIEFSGCEALTSLEGLPMRQIRNPRDGADQTPSGFLNFNDLKALRTLKGLPPLAPYIKEVMINRAPLLTSLEGLASTDDSIEELQIDQAGITDLEVLRTLKQLQRVEISYCPELADASVLGTLEHLVSVKITACPKLEVLPDAWKSQVKTLVLAGCGALKPIKALPPGINTKTIEIDDRKLLPRAKPAKALKSDVGAVWKLLSSRDIPTILSGLELSVALGEDFDGLVEGVAVKEGKLVRNKRFTGTGPAQPYLDLALFGLMCRARPGSAFASLRAQITQLDLVLCAQAPQLQGLTNLTRLTLHVGDDVIPDLSGFGPLPKLQSLKIGGRRWNATGRLVSLRGLEAPGLTECNLSCSGLEDVSALRLSPRIRQLDLSDNSALSDLSALEACAPGLLELNLRECKQVTSLDALSAAKKLKSLDLRECAGLLSVQPLASCTALQTLDLESCSALRSLQGLSQLPIVANKTYDGTSEFSLDGCHALESLDHLPAFPAGITALSLNDMRGLKNLRGLREFASVTHLAARNSGLINLGDIGALPALTRVDLDDCKSLQDATPLGTLKALQEVILSDSGVTTLPQGWSGPVSRLNLKNCRQLKSLGRLPASLARLECDGSSSLPVLDGMQDCTGLEVISVETCTALASLGKPPASLREVHARGCGSLTSLQGLEACPQLQVAGIPLSVTDASALKAVPGVMVRIDLNELGKPAKKGELQVLHAALIKAVNTLPAVKLDVKGPSGSWYSDRVIDMTVFQQFKTLETLSFSEFDFSCKIEEMSWLVAIEGLQGLVFASRGNMSHILDGGVHDSARKVKALQLRICKEAKIKPPAHLAD